MLGFFVIETCVRASTLRKQVRSQMTSVVWGFSFISIGKRNRVGSTPNSRGRLEYKNTYVMLGFFVYVTAQFLNPRIDISKRNPFEEDSGS